MSGLEKILLYCFKSAVLVVLLNELLTDSMLWYLTL